MGRKISFLLALVMLITIIPFNSFADNEDKGLKEAIVRAKELFNIGNEYDNFSPEVSTRDGKNVYYLNWSDSNEKLGDISIIILEDGTVLNYSKWLPRYEESKPKLPKISREEGLKIARDFIKKVSPKFGDSISYVEVEEPLNIHTNVYRYRFVRTENGAPYYNNTIDINIDNSTGEIEDYYTNWDLSLKFPAKEDILSLEKAEELYREKIGLELIYRRVYTDRKPDSFLVYGPLYMNHNIDANSGEIVYAQDYHFMEESADMGGMGSAIKEAELSPEEQDAIDEISGFISKEEAEKLARGILDLDSEYELRSGNLYPNWASPKEYRWQLTFEKRAEDFHYFASIGINAKTKELISFYKDMPTDPNGKAKYNKEESLKIAEDYIKKMTIDKFDKLELEENPAGTRTVKEPKSYTFRFRRKLDKAYVDGDYISLIVDATNGRIREYNMKWTGGDFPSKDNVIPVDKAYKVLFEDIGMELKYVYFDRYEGAVKEDKEATLVYGLKTDKPANIDANTGNILNNRGEPYKAPGIVKYKDIDSSYAKDKIEILAQYGIALAGEDFKPKEKITQRDFLYLLAKAKYPYGDIDKSDKELYRLLLNEGIIKEGEEAAEKIIIKEEAVKYLIRALKYDKLADIVEIYQDIFRDTEDIDPKLKGYVAIAYGLKIVEGSNGKFNPKAELKREDGANMIYNYLFSGH